MIKDAYNLSTRKTFPCRENLRRVKVNLPSFSFLFISRLNKANLQEKLSPIIQTPLKEVRKDG
jgi:hypothetical protein